MKTNLIEESKFITLYEKDIEKIDNILSKLNLKSCDINNNKKCKINSLVFMGPSGRKRHNNQYVIREISRNFL